MADNNKENRMSIDDFDFAHEDANDDTSMLVNYLVTRLHQAMGNPALQGEVQQQLHAYGILPPIQQERGPERFQGETSKRGLSTEKGVENPYQELKQLLEGKPSSKKTGHAQPERSPSREREESEPSDESMEDVAPRRRRAQRSPTPTKRKRSPHSPHRRESKREEKNSKKKKERKRSPSSPSSSPSSSSDEGSGYSSQERQRRGHRRSYAAWKRSSKLKKFKEGGKNISFLTYDGTFGGTDKVLAFIQQFDAAFGDEGFTESSKLRHVAMHFQKSARQWWASLRANGEAPKTWKALRASIMKQFLASDAKDKLYGGISNRPREFHQPKSRVLVRLLFTLGVCLLAILSVLIFLSTEESTFKTVRYWGAKYALEQFTPFLTNGNARLDPTYKSRTASTICPCSNTAFTWTSYVDFFTINYNPPQV
ncbi:hypothetical protein L7F22_062634 [Adiantum nelumboides]|nr:hypothetical protein [Adiantum nelumboides]